MFTSPVSRYTAEHGAIVDSFLTFVRRELVPLAAQVCTGTLEEPGDDVRRFVRKRSAQLGFYAGEYPEGAGGCGMPFAAKTLLYEAAERSSCVLAPLALSSAEGPSPLLLKATPEQQGSYLRPLVSGELTRCLALTEAGGGSDASTLGGTRAEPLGDGWVIRGRKSFVSRADEADLVIVVALVQNGAGRGLPGVFVLDRRTPGLVIESVSDGLGEEHLCEVLLDGVQVAESRLLGGRDAIGLHSGWMTSALARGRLVVAASSNGMAAQALDLGLDFIRHRESFGVKLGAHQHVQEHIVKARVALESSRLLTFAAAETVDEQAEAYELAAMAKLTASEGACETVDAMLQLHGAAGWLSAHPIHRLYRRVRATRIVEGTSEIQKNILAAAEGLG